MDADAPTTPHDKHVAEGMCPSINKWKTWCNDFAGHPGPHWAPLLLPDGSQRRVTWA